MAAKKGLLPLLRLVQRRRRGQAAVAAAPMVAAVVGRCRCSSSSSWSSSSWSWISSSSSPPPGDGDDDDDDNDNDHCAPRRNKASSRLSPSSSSSSSSSHSSCRFFTTTTTTTTTENKSDSVRNSRSSSRSSNNRLPRDFLPSLKRRHPNLEISTNTYDLDSHGRGESYHPAGSPPDAVIYPTNEHQIRDILRLCCREKKEKEKKQKKKTHHDDDDDFDNDNDDDATTTTTTVVEIVSIIPYGAGTSLEGHLNFLFPPPLTPPPPPPRDHDNDDEEEGSNGGGGDGGGGGGGNDDDPTMGVGAMVVDIPSSCFEDGGGNSSSSSSSLYFRRRVRVERRGGISIDMRNFRSIGEVVPGRDNFVRVGAGVTRNELNEALRHTGMQFMVDPGADATIGGMAACGASGTAAVRYGTMRENVLAMTAVLPPTTAMSAPRDGDDDIGHDDDDRTAGAGRRRTGDNGHYYGGAIAARVGCDALKSSAGYDLPALLTGSEGTLGIITEVAVRLHPVPSDVVAASCAFDDLHSAADAVATIRALGVPASRMELLDETSIRAFNRSLLSSGNDEGGGVDNDESGGGRSGDGDDDESLHLRRMDEKPTLFMEFAGHSEASALGDMNAAQDICLDDDFGGVNFAYASDEPTRRALWAARHRLYYSSIALRGGGAGAGDDDDGEGATPQSTVVTDVCVPLSSFADIVSATARDVREKGVVGPCFGHAGDGNFHCILPMKKNDTPEYRAKVFEVVENMIERAISVGGTCTGEHGVGYGKMKYLGRQYGEGGVTMMKAVKRALDPWNIMNPGKIVDNDFFGGYR